MRVKEIQLVILVIVLTSILSASFWLFDKYHVAKNNLDTKAASSSVELTTKADWQAGQNTNTKLNDPDGTVKISTVASSKIDLAAIYAADNSRVTTNFTTCPLPALVDDNPVTDCYASGDPGSVFYWTMNLGSNYTISQIGLDNFASTHVDATGARFQLSENGSDFSTLVDNPTLASKSPTSLGDPFVIAPTSATYIRLYAPFLNPFIDPDIAPTRSFNIAGIELHSPGLATHTSAATQIDGGAQFKDWTTFVPSGTILANTSINLRFRTSADAGTWSSWSASTPYAASIDISGLTQSRYLQVETTLANTDGASTPTLDSYTANYNYAVLDHVTVTPATATIQVNGTGAFSAVAYDDDGDVISGATFSWSADCGSVNGSGGYTAPAIAGSCIVTAETTVDGVTRSGTATVTVTAAPAPDQTCSDGIQNGSETGVDCGGSCAACPVVPPAPTCSDGIQNGDEMGVDTGGSCDAGIGGGGTCAVVGLDHIDITPLPQLLVINQNIIFTAVAYDVSGNVLTNADFSWQRSAGTLNASGVHNQIASYIAPSSVGNEWIKATVCDKSKTINSLVLESAPVSITVVASPDEAVVKPGATQQFYARVSDQSANDISSVCPVTWSMQNLDGGTINSTGLLTATPNIGTWMNLVKAKAECFGLSDFDLLTFVTSDQTRRLKWIWTNPWSATVREPIKSTQFSGVAYDQFNFRIPNASMAYSFFLLDDRIGTIPKNGKSINIYTSDNYGCYPNKLKLVAGYAGVEKSAFGSVSIYPPTYAFNSAGGGCDDGNENKRVGLSDKIFSLITGADRVYGATGQVFSNVTYNAAEYLRPGQVTSYLGVPRDQLNTSIDGVTVEYILHNTSAGELARNGKFIATTTAGSYAEAVEIKASLGDKIISKKFNVIVTSEKKKATTIMAWGPTGASELIKSSVLKMWPNSGYSFYSLLRDQFGDNVIGQGYAKIEDVSGKDLVNILGPTTLETKGKQGVFKNAIKVTYDVERANQNSPDKTDPIEGVSPVLYLTLDINTRNDDPTACLASGQLPCDPLDQACIAARISSTQCVGFDCLLKDVKGFGAGSALAMLLAALLALAIAALNSISNLASMFSNGQIFSIFAKGKDMKNSKGLIYDAFSGLPMPFANILLLKDGKDISMVTRSDKNGRFALLVKPGQNYAVRIQKTGFDILHNQINLRNGFIKYGLRYANNYFGDLFTVPGNNYFFDKNIPLIPNSETAKLAQKTRHFGTLAKVLIALNWLIILAGFSFAVYAIYSNYSIFNLVVFSMYGILFIIYTIKNFWFTGKSFGTISAEGQPLDLALVRIMRQKDNRLIRTLVSDRKGRFGLVLPKGFYKVAVGKSGYMQEGDVDLLVKADLKPISLIIKLKKIEMPTIQSNVSDTNQIVSDNIISTTVA